MASLRTTPILSLSSSSIHQLHGSKDTIPLEKNLITTQIYEDLYSPTNKSNNLTVQLYAILEEVADRIQMHTNIGEQRNNWNTLLLNSVNMITLTATAMAGPSQLAEEQRNATRLFKQLHTQIQTIIALGNPTEKDVKSSMEKVLAIDRAYPLPLLGAMLDKFPAKYEPAVWWPSSQSHRRSKTQESKRTNNGWSEDLEKELREVIEVIKKKDCEDYERLGNIALKVSKSFAIAGPLLSGIAAVGSSFVGNGSLAALVPLMAGSLASAVNAFEHGGQVGMTIRDTLEEKDIEKRENGEVFEMKVAMKLGRSVSELRRLASKSASCGMEGMVVDEFASKLF
ncbi:hypothetical protein PHAVU_003G080600 [Phaseolus vulgaris]